ncbi:hypothetical protein JW906_08780 [bacterium]|nr:hypothetical protein [bacterium]
MKKLNRIALLLLLGIFFSGCEESGNPADNSDSDGTAKKITLNDLYGTFKLEHMQFVYYGTAITDTVSDETPGLTITGTMTLAKTGEIIQSVDITHADSTQNIMMAGKVMEIPSDTVMVIQTGGEQKEAGFLWKNPRLTLILFGRTSGNVLYKDTETWRRTSRIIAKQSDIQKAASGRPLAWPFRETALGRELY